FSILFTVKPSSYIEVFTDESPEKQVLNLARNKVLSLLESDTVFDGSIILGADTCIDLDGKIIGKPRGPEEAEKMLNSFSGRTHKVITALALYNGKNGTFCLKKRITAVTFADLSTREIEWYLNTEEWDGAAGGYRIQEKGSLLITGINGSWYNVMGLPIRLFYGMVASQGLTLFRT
ncbi:MAG: Maf family protein, partial [Spirochaetales bacterium]|nr:Maf family protein [Spirochaetales bacterium]